jgi:hypothetical protein
MGCSEMFQTAAELCRVTSQKLQGFILEINMKMHVCKFLSKLFWDILWVCLNIDLDNRGNEI